MNIIVIYGSPHLSGTTASLLGAFLSGFRKAQDPDGAPARRGVHPDGLSGGAAQGVEMFHAYKMDIRPCEDCGVCASGDKCRFGDLDGFDAALRRCPGIVIATPVYHSSFPAPLKALMDRTQRYYIACRENRPVFPGARRPCAALLSAGQKNESGGVIKEQLRHILPPLGARLSEFVVAGGTDRDPAASSALAEAEESGGRFFASLSGNGDTLPVQ